MTIIYRTVAKYNIGRESTRIVTKDFFDLEKAKASLLKSFNKENEELSPYAMKADGTINDDPYGTKYVEWDDNGTNYLGLELGQNIDSFYIEKVKNVKKKVTTIEELRDYINSQMVTMYSRELFGDDNSAITIERMTVKKRLAQVENSLMTGKEVIEEGDHTDMDEESINQNYIYVYDIADNLPVKVGNNLNQILDFINTDEMQNLNGDNGQEEWSTVPDAYADSDCNVFDY